MTKRNLFIDGLATFAALGAAAGTAALTLEIARQREDAMFEGSPQWARAVARLRGERADQNRQLMLTAATAGAALGVLTFQSIRIIGSASAGDELE